MAYELPEFAKKNILANFYLYLGEQPLYSCPIEYYNKNK